MKYNSSKIGALRAYAIWESILNGDSLVYEKTEFSDIEDLLDISPTKDITNYEIETHINRCFLEKGYEWVGEEVKTLTLVH